MFRRMTRERYLSDVELRRFFDFVRVRRHVHQPRDHALFALLANAGLRPQEARALTRRDVRCGARPAYVCVAREKKGHGPTPITRLVLHPKVAKVVAQYVANLTADPRTKLFPFTKRQADRLWRYYADKAGIPPTYRLYALRHSYGMRLWRHTRDLRLMQALMGHVHLKTATSYEHVSPEQLRAAYASLGTVA